MAEAIKSEEWTVKNYITLTLTEEEAVFLKDVLDCVGGDPLKSRRRFETSINKALRDVGVYYFEPLADMAKDIDEEKGGIWFKSDSER